MSKLLNYDYFLTEGLIHTYPISIYKDTLLNNLSHLNKKNIIYELIIGNKETFKIELSKCKFNDIQLVDSFCGNLGYFLSKFKIYKYQKENIIKYNPKTFEQDIKNNDGIVLFYESKFDNEIIINFTVYHATNIKNIDGILKNGIYPKAESRIDYHYERIYLFNDLIDCIKLIPKLRIFSYSKIKDYVIFEINTNNFEQNEYNGEKNKVKFYIDPKSAGAYTYNNIPINKLKLLNKIYTEESIIDFDSYKINSIKNPIYIEFFNENNPVYKLYRKNLNKIY